MMKKKLSKRAYRYLLFQIPGTVLVSIVLIALNYEGWLESSTAIALIIAWVLKDIFMYPLVKKAYSVDTPYGAAKLRGEPGVTREELSPDGYVEVRGELWRAVSEDQTTIASGHPVEIIGGEGLTLKVRPRALRDE